MSTFTIKTEGVNVEEIMKEIHRRVMEKKQAGVYTDEDIKRLSELKNDLSPKKNERHSELNLHLRRLHSTWDAAASGGSFASHRKFLGPVIVVVKKLGFKFIRFFGSAFFTRQTEFNSANVRFNSVVTEELARLSEENRQLRTMLEELLQQLEKTKG